MTARDVIHHQTAIDERSQTDRDRTRPLLDVAGFSLNAPATLKYCLLLLLSTVVQLAIYCLSCSTSELIAYVRVCLFAVCWHVFSEIFLQNRWWK